jgi:hypothetical protein
VTTPSLPSLATADDVVARLGRPLNQIENQRIGALLADGSAHIRRYCFRDFAHVANDVRRLRSDRGVIKLPGRPINAVNSVTAIGGAPGIPDISVFWYSFDKIDEITVPEPIHSGVINLPELWYDLDWFTSTFIVDYDHGDSNVPDDVVAVLTTAVISMLVAPTMVGGLASETMGTYSYSMHRTAGSGMLAELTVAGLPSLAAYRPKIGTISISG